jgi:NAD(P)H-dependent FMN reductase
MLPDNLKTRVSGFRLEWLWNTHFSTDKEAASGIPTLATDFYSGLNLLVISFAEHNGAYSAAFKIFFDWTSKFMLKHLEKNKP